MSKIDINILAATILHWIQKISIWSRVYLHILRIPNTHNIFYADILIFQEIYTTLKLYRICNNGVFFIVQGKLERKICSICWWTNHNNIMIHLVLILHKWASFTFTNQRNIEIDFISQFCNNIKRLTRISNMTL